MTHLRFALLVISAAALFAGASASAQTVPTYTANYEVQYNDRRAGESQFSVRRADDGAGYVFESSTRLRGLVARLVAPRPIVELSHFAAESQMLRPVTFSYEDGSRKGEDNYSLEFLESVVGLTTSEGRREISLDAPVLDRGTAQVAIMIDALSGAVPASYRLVDDDGLVIYEVDEIEPATATTLIGDLPTRRFTQQRKGSSRSTVFWLAPDLDFLPVRIEQMRNGEVRLAFILESVERP